MNLNPVKVSRTSTPYSLANSANRSVVTTVLATNEGRSSLPAACHLASTWSTKSASRLVAIQQTEPVAIRHRDAHTVRIGVSPHHDGRPTCLAKATASASAAPSSGLGLCTVGNAPSGIAWEGTS